MTAVCDCGVVGFGWSEPLFELPMPKSLLISLANCLWEAGTKRPMPRLMIKALTVLALAALTSCSTLKHDCGLKGVRFSAGGGDIIARESGGPGGNGAAVRTRVELVREVQPNLDVSLLLAYGVGYIGEADTDSYDVGASFRRYFGESAMRPFVEVTAGYRRTDYDLPPLGTESTDAIFGSGGLGLELRATEHLVLFGVAGYEGSFGSDVTTNGGVGFVGMAWNF